jgi:RNA polymerase sigma factor for flagellar operon FliA
MEFDASINKAASAFAFKYGLSESDKEDLAQEARIRILKQQPEDNITHYMTIARDAFVQWRRTTDWLSDPRRRLVRKMLSEQDRLRAILKREPKDSELADSMQMTINDLHSLLYDAVSGQVEITEEHMALLTDTVEDDSSTPEEIVGVKQLYKQLEGAVYGLPQKYRAVVVGLFLDRDMSHEAIAERTKSTPEEVKETQEEAIQLLRKQLLLD